MRSIVLDNDLTIVSLLLDIAGAIWLAKALAFGSPEAYVATTRAGDTIGVPVHGDLGHAKDVADAQIGTSLLVLGFVGQGVAALGRECVNSSPLWWLVVLLIPIGWVIGRWRYHVVVLQTMEARLFNQLWEWAIVVDAYELALGRDGDRGSTLSRLFGANEWATIESDLKRERAARRDVAEWIVPERPKRSHWRSIRKWRDWLGG